MRTLRLISVLALVAVVAGCAVRGPVAQGRAPADVYGSHGGYGQPVPGGYGQPVPEGYGQPSPRADDRVPRDAYGRPLPGGYGPPGYGGGYDQPPSRGGYGQPVPPGAYAQFGQVVRIDALPGGERRGNGSGAGAAIGGVIGAILGHEVGNSRNGRATGSFIGAVAGAIIGNEIERDQGGRHGPVTRITIALDGGGARTVDLPYGHDFRIGDRVRLEGNRVFRSM